MKHSTRLFRAAKILDRDGWCKHGRNHRRNCVYTATTAVPGYPFEDDAAVTVAYGVEHEELWAWNDDLCRDGNEAAMLLEFGGHYLRSEGR